MVEHAADLITKLQVGSDGKTAYERIKGKKFGREMVEFGEKVHFKENAKNDKNNKMEPRWGEGYFLGMRWRTGEAAIGKADGVIRASTIRRVGAHRRWDKEGLNQVKGWPWKRKPDEDEGPVNLRVRWLEDGEVPRGPIGKEDTRVNRMRLSRADFIKHGFTEGCIGCRALLSGTGQRGHNERCRQRMGCAIAQSPDGQARKDKQDEKENVKLARVIERAQEEEDRRKRRNVGREDRDGGAAGSSGDPRTSQDMPMEGQGRNIEVDKRPGDSSQGGGTANGVGRKEEMTTRTAS